VIYPEEDPRRGRLDPDLAYAPFLEHGPDGLRPLWPPRRFLRVALRASTSHLADEHHGVDEPPV
jgi:hypothetical protein